MPKPSERIKEKSIEAKPEDFIAIPRQCFYEMLDILDEQHDRLSKLEEKEGEKV